MVRTAACLAGAAALAALVASVATGSPVAETQTCKPTPSDTAGPFNRTAVASPRRSRIGKGHVLQGRVLRASDCKPVARALVVFWQAGPGGYGPRGRGSVLTDRAGRFRIQGPVPTSYGGLPHIHIAVLHADYEELVTRYVVRRGAKSGSVRFVLAPLL